MTALQNRLDLILPRIKSAAFLQNDGMGNEIGFWVFDYPAKSELQVRTHLKDVDEKINKLGYHFVHLNIFEVLIEMLEERGLFDRACQREMQIGVDGLRKTLAGPLSQENVAKYISDKYQPTALEFVFLSGLGSAWPLVRGHELLSAMQDVMGSTPLVLFYPGEYSGTDLHPFGIIESKNYYRAFKLVPEDGTQFKSREPPE